MHLTAALNETYAVMRIATVLGMVLALPLAFVVVLTQVNGLQDTSKGLVPTAIDPVFGMSTFAILLLVIMIGVGGLFAALAFISGR